MCLIHHLTNALGLDLAPHKEDGRTFKARSVVLAMGAWTTRVPGLESLPLEITEESVGYFEPKAGSEGVDHTYRHMPVFLHRAPNGIEGRVDQGFYGLPQVEIKGVKVAAHHVGPVVDPDRRLAARAAGGDADAAREQRKKVGPACGCVIRFIFWGMCGWLCGDGFGVMIVSVLRSIQLTIRTQQQALATTVEFVARVFPHLEPTPTHTLTCLYSVTPDHDFVLDQHPTMPNVSKGVVPVSGIGWGVPPPNTHCRPRTHPFKYMQPHARLQVYVAAGFSGHGFKFGSALGEIMACLALQAPFPPLLEQAMAKGRFGLKRFAEGGNKDSIVFR